MKCVLVDCSGLLQNWWSIEREQTDWCSGHSNPSQISDAPVSGSALELRIMASAIRNLDDVYFDACAAERDGDTYLLYNPRQGSVGGAARLTMQEASDLADCITKNLGGDIVAKKQDDALDQLRQEAEDEQTRLRNETIEDDIMRLRADVAAQARLMKEMKLPGFDGFLDRILDLEALHQIWDELE